MATEYLKRLCPRLEEDVDGIQVTDDGLEAVLDVRYGEVPLLIEHDEDSASIRIGVAVPPPVGAGRKFLLWLLALNTQYWDLKVGVDDRGSLLFHSDVDVPSEDAFFDGFASLVLERVECVLDLLDDDLIDYLLAHGLGTPAQRVRWDDTVEEELELG